MSELTAHRQSLRAEVFDVLERGRRGTWSHVFDMFIVAVIILNVAIAVIETVASIQAVWGPWLRVIDTLCVAIFVAEYAGRIWSAPEHPLYYGKPDWRARLAYALTPLMLIDMLAILPFFLELVWGVDVAAVRVIRIIRFYRLARYVPAIATIGRVLAAEWRALVGSMVIFFGLLLIASVAIYLAERHAQPEAFGDVPSAMWWAVVTLSTVGYGDVTPITVLGKIIAGFVMLAGLAFLALPVGIIANGFQQEIKQRDFVVSFAMVARVPLFNRMEPSAIARLVRLLHAKKFNAGGIVMSKGEDADSMFFITYGEVEVELPKRTIRLGDGDFFGEMALMSHESKRVATVTAVRPTDLLVLSAPDFRRLMVQHPEIQKVMHETAQQRKQQDEAADRPA